MMLAVTLHYPYVCFLLWLSVCLFFYISWNIHRDSFSKLFFSLHTEIKVSSCDIYFADNVGETVRHLIGENHGHPRMCIFFNGCHPTDVIVFTYVDTLSYIRWTLVFCDNMDQDKGPWPLTYKICWQYNPSRDLCSSNCFTY